MDIPTDWSESFEGLSLMNYDQQRLTLLIASKIVNRLVIIESVERLIERFNADKLSIEIVSTDFLETNYIIDVDEFMRGLDITNIRNIAFYIRLAEISSKDDSLESELIKEGINMVDWGKYKEVKVGQRQNTKIKQIKEGVAKEFFTADYFAKMKNQADVPQAQNQPAIQIICENGASIAMNLPAGETIHPKMQIAKFKKTFGKFPEVGMEVETYIDENGFNRIAILD